MHNFKQKLAALAVLSTPMLVASTHAVAAIDVSDITDAITEAGTAGATVGAAVVVMLVGIKVFKWLRRAL